MKPVPDFLRTSANLAILDFAQGKSCHGDMSNSVFSALEGIEGVSAFCPDPASFHYVLWYCGDRIFAAGTGMRRVTLHLSEFDGAQACACFHALPNAEVEGWFDISPFQRYFAEWLIKAMPIVT